MFWVSVTCSNSFLILVSSIFRTCANWRSESYGLPKSVLVHIIRCILWPKHGLNRKIDFLKLCLLKIKQNCNYVRVWEHTDFHWLNDCMDVFWNGIACKHPWGTWLSFSKEVGWSDTKMHFEAKNYSQVSHGSWRKSKLFIFLQILGLSCKTGPYMHVPRRKNVFYTLFGKMRGCG